MDDREREASAIQRGQALIVADTSLLVAHLRGLAPARSILRSRGDEIVIPTLVAWELWKGADRAKDQAAVEALVEEFPLDPFVGGMARIAGALQIEQRREGRERQVFDLLIASHALYHGGAVATYDRDYEAIRGLQVVKPARR